MKKLKEKRIQKGLTQEQLGQAVGVSYRTIYQYESGRREPNLKILRALANALQCTIDEIVN